MSDREQAGAIHGDPGEYGMTEGMQNNANRSHATDKPEGRSGDAFVSHPMATDHPVPTVKGVPIDVIIDRIANGALVPEIANEIGCSQAAIVIACGQHDPQRYQDARLTRTIVRLDATEYQLQEADDQLKLARARELFRAVSWRAEREHPDRWGTRPTTQIGIAGTQGIQVQIVSYAQQHRPTDDMLSAPIQQSPNGYQSAQGKSMLTGGQSNGTGPMKRDSDG